MIDVGRIGPDEWATLRDIRLTALAEAPYAFASTHQREVAYDEQRWRERLGQGAWFIARRGGRPVGVIAGVAEADGSSGGRHVVSMWVSPEARGAGVADGLLRAVCDWARAGGATALTLWVADGNVRARRFYERAGFRGTGRRQPLPSDPSLGEEEMRLAL